MQITFAVSEADFLRADSLYRKQPGPLSDTLQFRAAHAFKTGDVARQEAFYKAYSEQKDLPAWRFGYALFHNVENADAARRFISLSEDEKRPAPQQVRSQIALADLDAEQGRLRAAVDRIRKTNIPNRTKGYADYASSPLSVFPREQVEAMLAEVLAMDSVATDSTPEQQTRPLVRLYRAAVLSCQARDYAAAARYAQRIRSVPVPAYWQASLGVLATEIDARIDIENGRPLEGLRKLEQQRTTVASDLGQPFGWGAAGAVWRAEALLRLQRYDEAARWFDNLDDAIISDMPHISYILLRRAQIADSRNESEKARDLYARFLKLWDNPDPELKPIVDQARSRLAALHARVG